MDEAKLKLTLRLIPADDQPPDPVVFDDIVRLIRQAVVTAPKDAPQVTAPADGFHEPNENEKRSLDSLEVKIKHRIEQASAASQAVVEKRVETGDLPDKSLAAAQRVVSSVQRAILRRVAVDVPESGG